MKRTTAVLAIAFMLLLFHASSRSQQLEAPPVVQPTAYPTNAIIDYFPLAKGAYWVYEGTIVWTVDTEVMEKTVSWEMEVVEAIEAVQDNGVTAYVMKGWPGDLAWYEEGKERSDYAIIQSGQTRFYRTCTEVVQRLQDKDDSLYGLVEEDELFLDIPLLPGKKFCEAEHITSYNGGYCWIVGAGEQVELDITGLSASGTLTEYGIWQGTQPDDVYIGFIPGVGISRFRYRHHGTVSVVDVRLVEYHRGEGNLNDNQ